MDISSDDVLPTLNSGWPEFVFAPIGLLVPGAENVNELVDGCCTGWGADPPNVNTDEDDAEGVVGVEDVLLNPPNGDDTGGVVSVLLLFGGPKAEDVL